MWQMVVTGERYVFKSVDRQSHIGTFKSEGVLEGTPDCYLFVRSLFHFYLCLQMRPGAASAIRGCWWTEHVDFLSPDGGWKSGPHTVGHPAYYGGAAPGGARDGDGRK